MTEWITLGTIATAALTIVTLGCVMWARLNGHRRAARAAQSTGFTLSGCTLARYEPMTRLLTGEDLEFLRQHGSCGPKLAARWKRSRRRIFRMYLSDLAADFQGLHAEARALLAEAPEQYSDLAGVLLRQQVTFWRVMAGIELRLALSWMGLGRIDARRLMDALAVMQREIARLTPPAPVPVWPVG
jgi:hypothetical protein